MKNTVIMFLLIICSFFLIDNVNAQAYDNILDEVKTIGVSFECDYENDVLYINNHSTNTSCTQFGTTDYDSLYYYVFGNYINVSTKPAVYATGNYGSSYHSYGLMNIPGSTKAIFNYFYNDGSPWFSRTGYTTNSGTSPEKWMGTDNKLIEYIYTNVDIYKYDSSNKNGNWADTSKLLYEANAISKTPTILITKESENSTIIDDVEYITDITLKIDFGLIDNEKYLYMYKYGSDSEWTTITLTQNTYINKTYFENNTLYVQILDRSTHEYIVGSTYTINSIVESINEKVKIYFQKISKDFDSELYNQCTISQGNISYRACETIAISFDVINYNNYIYEMSLDGITWEDVSTKIYNNFYLERLFENKTIYIRVLNRIDYSYNNSATYKESSIESTENLGQKVLFGSSYYADSPNIDVMALFINYDPNNYNYFYSLYSSSDSFINITDSIDCKNNLCTYKTRIYVKGTMYIRIEDKNGNLIYTATYTVDYYRWMNTNSPFDKEDFFSTFFDSIDYFLNPIKEIFNSITIFFDSLPIEIKYTFYVSFVIIIILFLIKFIL